MVSADMFDEMQQEWAPLDDPVFQLTPTSFHTQITDHYTSLGCPAISRGTFWDIYKLLLVRFQRVSMDVTFKEEFDLANIRADQDMDLIPGLRQLRIGDEVVGDGVVLQEDYDEADFTSDTDNEEDIYADFTDNDE
jgi:hypothetical protein